MFQFDWASRGLWSQEPLKIDARDSISDESIRGAMLLHWQEHCVECALPLCYANCALYVPRKDRHCARFAYGIVRNRNLSGLLSCAADLRFRRWGKLEAILTGRYLPLFWIRLLDKVDWAVTPMVSALAYLFSGIDPKRRLNRGLSVVREYLVENLGKRGVAFEEVVIECYSFQKESCKLIVEMRKNRDTLYREALELAFGQNRFSLRIPLPPLFGRADKYRMMVYPDNDQELRVAFTWLDFVVRRGNQAADRALASSDAHAEPLANPAAKVKCVAWDLDNTLWRGTLIEDGEQNIRIRPEAEKLVRWLDERGIVQTIVSKNQHEDAMAVLTRCGLDEFFLYPAINWGPKSANLMQIADRLNINIDSFALIDDSPFERREVANALPMVRVYPDNVFAELRGLPEFDIPITEASRLRRKSYMTEMQREKVKEVFGADHIEFLRSCQLKMRLFRPSTQSEIERCLELIQRSSQLNLSSRRYNSEQFKALLARRDALCVAMACEDRFGDYGVVGFASIDRRGGDPVARDFVLSCRVAQKHVEHAFYGWLGNLLKQQGATMLMVELIKSARNGPLVRVFEEMPFTVVSSDGEAVSLSLDLNAGVSYDSVVAVDDSAFAAEKAS
jgi:FkbH-like protein